MQFHKHRSIYAATFILMHHILNQDLSSHTITIPHISACNSYLTLSRGHAYVLNISIQKSPKFPNHASDVVMLTKPILTLFFSYLKSIQVSYEILTHASTHQIEHLDIIQSYQFSY